MTHLVPTIALIYMRQSGTDESSASLSDQVRECRVIPALAAWDIIEVITDGGGRSATLDEDWRPGLAELFRRIEHDPSVRVVAPTSVADARRYAIG